jgi:hypothetical protein
MNRLLLVSVLLLTLTGCSLFNCPQAPLPDQYHAPGFDAARLSRVLVLPLCNETQYTDAAEEVRLALAAELQNAARFEVVVAPPDALAVPSQRLHDYGRFDEAEVLELARRFQADAVLLGALTQYQPYIPPRIGVSLQLINPAEAAVAVSVNGLWDSREKALAEEAQAFHMKLMRPCDKTGFGDVVLSSPQLYQRFVCHQIVQVLLGPPKHG